MYTNYTYQRRYVYKLRKSIHVQIDMYINYTYQRRYVYKLRKSIHVQLSKLVTTMPQFNPNLPWNDIPELPPATDLESRAILKACISAMTELSRANALVKTLPNEEVLINTLPLQEARRSSEIENIVTTNDDLYRAMASDRGCVKFLAAFLKI